MGMGAVSVVLIKKNPKLELNWRGVLNIISFFSLCITLMSLIDLENFIQHFKRPVSVL